MRRFTVRSVSAGAPWVAALLFPFLVGGADAGGRQPAPEPVSGLASKIESLMRTVPDRGAVCAVAVIDLSANTEVYSLNADQAIIPASNQKLFVMAAAIDLLGPDFQFRTVVGMRGQDLVIVGDGDPAIGDPRLSESSGRSILAPFDAWADELKGKGWALIPGDLIIDESIFDRRYVHQSWAATELQKWYAAPVGALNVHDNCIEVTVSPGAKGSAAAYRVVPANSIVQIVNRCISASKGVPVIARPEPTFRYLINGQCGSVTTLEPVAVPDPVAFFANVCRTALEQAGVTIRGSVRRKRLRASDGELPADLTVVTDYRTPIRDVLRRIGKDSQNLFAECLAKRIGYEHMRRISPGPSIGSWPTAAAAVSAFLRRSGINKNGFVFSDASGLSRDNRATVRQIASLLARMHHHSGRALFVNSLSIAGRDGSLAKRMADVNARVRGKTGTLRGVRALSGYVQGDEGEGFAFSIIFNDIRGAAAPYKRIQDDLCRLLATSASSTPP